jgi:hypothetical protein
VVATGPWNYWVASLIWKDDAEFAELILPGADHYIGESILAPSYRRVAAQLNPGYFAARGKDQA